MIDRKLYKKYFSKDDIPNWKCPTCNNSILSINENKIISKNNSFTEINQGEDGFEPEMASFIFTVIFSCNNPKCKEVVSCCGSGYWEEEPYDDYKNMEQRLEYVSYYTPHYFYPPLHFFEIPKKTPEDVSNAIIQSFSLFFTNKSSSANQIRVALECLLTHLKINKYEKRFNKKTNKNYMNRLSLNDRIKLLKPKYQHIKDLCIAIKWLGNSGSHCGEELTSDNIFDGYDLLSVLLEELYNNKQEHAKKLAKKINTKKGV